MLLWMKDAAMEECQAIITRILSSLPLLWHCSPEHCYRCPCCGVTSIGMPRRSGEKQFQYGPSLFSFRSFAINLSSRNLALIAVSQL